jgi:site-specific DNA recombinase
MRTALYVRVSSDRQDVDLSVTAQLKALREYATRNGHSVVREFIDEVESGRTPYRPQFRQMIAMAKQTDKPFDLILIYKYSRFARNREDSIVYKAFLRKNGVQLSSITEPVEDTAMGRFMESIIECLDEFYSENLGEEVTRGMRESASRGFYLCSRAPYGYHRIKVNDGGKERTKLDIDQFQSQVVAQIFEEVASGKGLIEIVKELNSKGIAGPKGNAWGKTTVHNILSNEIYTGAIIWGQHSKRGLPPVRVDNACPAIVDRETFRRAQDLLRARSFARVHPQRISSRYLLSGIARCGHCGRALTGVEAKSGKFAYYVCGTLIRKGAQSCPSRYLNAGKLEELVIEKIKDHVLPPTNLIRLAKMVTEELNRNMATYETEIRTVDAAIADVGTRLVRLYDALETGKISLDVQAPRIRELKERQDKLEGRKNELRMFMIGEKAEVATQQEVAKCAADFQELLEEGSLLEKKAFVRSFVDEVRVTGDHVLVNYRLPMPLSKSSTEKNPVLDIVRYGGEGGTRTPTPFKAHDPKSCSSANSDTSPIENHLIQ